MGRCFAQVRRVIALVVLLAGVGVAAAASDATATVSTYCVATRSFGSDCYGPRHSLRQNRAYNYDGNSGYYVAAAALIDEDVAIIPYGNWKYGWGMACHPYSGSNLLYPWLYNADSRTQRMYGASYYGSAESGVCP
jgi:hypothetical protein